MGLVLQTWGKEISTRRWHASLASSPPRGSGVQALAIPQIKAVFSLPSQILILHFSHVGTLDCVKATRKQTDQHSYRCVCLCICRVCVCRCRCVDRVCVCFGESCSQKYLNISPLNRSKERMSSVLNIHINNHKCTVNTAVSPYSLSIKPEHRITYTEVLAHSAHITAPYRLQSLLTLATEHDTPAGYDTTRVSPTVLAPRIKPKRPCRGQQTAR